MHSAIELTLTRTQAAVEALFAEPGLMFKRQLHEQSVTFRLGVQLQQQFPDMLVDCEYNRDVTLAKKLASKGLFRPDIVVHKRQLTGTENNRLVVEARKSRTWNSSYPKLRERLCELTKLDGRFAYQLGLCWRIDQNQNAVCHEAHWFYNGQLIGESSLDDFKEHILKKLQRATS